MFIKHPFNIRVDDCKIRGIGPRFKHLPYDISEYDFGIWGTHPSLFTDPVIEASIGYVCNVEGAPSDSQHHGQPCNPDLAGGPCSSDSVGVGCGIENMVDGECLAQCVEYWVPPIGAPSLAYQETCFTGSCDESHIDNDITVYPGMPDANVCVSVCLFLFLNFLFSFFIFLLFESSKVR